jgi:hypothetical protein
MHVAKLCLQGNPIPNHDTWEVWREEPFELVVDPLEQDWQRRDVFVKRSERVQQRAGGLIREMLLSRHQRVEPSQWPNTPCTDGDGDGQSQLRF